MVLLHTSRNNGIEKFYIKAKLEIILLITAMHLIKLLISLSLFWTLLSTKNVAGQDEEYQDAVTTEAGDDFKDYELSYVENGHGGDENKIDDKNSDEHLDVEEENSDKENKEDETVVAETGNDHTGIENGEYHKEETVIVHTVTDTSSDLQSLNEESEEFLVPKSVSTVADSFTFGRTEYIIVQSPLQFSQAQTTCVQSYNGILATIKDNETAMFLAEAFSETNLDLNSAWIGARRKTNGTKWIWTSDHDTVDADLYNNLICENPHKKPSQSDSNCLAFGISTHLNPQLRALHCSSLRSFICQKEQALRVKGLSSDNATHPGWIQIGRKKFKIFYNRITWSSASTQCPKHNINSTLAVVTSYEESQILGRYLLVGRPSLENAWIGAKYTDDFNSYYYSDRYIGLANVSDKNNFPPWRERHVKKIGGCVLLDRHLSNITLFIEARCNRLRPYICSMDTAMERAITFEDSVSGDTAYRVIYNEMTWDGARTHCKNSYGDYGGILAEITDVLENYHILYLMGENRTDLRHIWLGGKYDGKHWKWSSSGATIDPLVLNFVENSTYSDDVEFGNICLNMDRENHMSYLHYGTDCSWSQPFICTFNAENLDRLKNDETNNSTSVLYPSTI
ncbi:hypothetical protein FQA39_LY04688 [Lamprigera yunnana]|nr:hypothetical protein FQA39_LY04688 [Lamprigera yunnana]